MLALIMALLQLNGALANSSGEIALFEKVQHSKAVMQAARTMKSKLEELDRLKYYLATDAGRLLATEPAAQRRLRFTIEGLRIYLEYLNRDDLAAGRCSAIRDQIILAADPRGSEPELLPGEAREALAILTAICLEKHQR